MLYSFKTEDNFYGDPPEGNIIIYADSKQEALNKFDEIAIKEAKITYEQEKECVEMKRKSWEDVVMPDIETYIKNYLDRVQEYKQNIREFGDVVFSQNGVRETSIFSWNTGR